jgi:Heavy-metal resistance
MTKLVTVLTLGLLLLGGATVALAFHEEYGRAVTDLFDQFRGLGAQLERHLGNLGGTPTSRDLGGAAAAVDRPLISLMLDHRAELGLTLDQVSRLEGLRTAFARESIKRDADIRVGEMDLATLLEQEPLDMGKVEAKIQEVSKLRADLQIGRLRTLEQGRAVLTPEQRTKLKALLATASGGSPRAAERPVRM